MNQVLSYTSSLILKDEGLWRPEALCFRFLLGISLISLPFMHSSSLATGMATEEVQAWASEAETFQRTKKTWQQVYLQEVERKRLWFLPDEGDWGNGENKSQDEITYSCFQDWAPGRMCDICMALSRLYIDGPAQRTWKTPQVLM